MMIGFYIKKVVVKGEGKNDAQVCFEKGLNVIHGPSNTGKSYIFQCIDYMFGATQIKDINESKGYNKIYMEIRNIITDAPTTIVRFLDNNKIFYANCDIDNVSSSNFKVLKAKHDPEKDDNISKFLLSEIGIVGNKYLIKNADAKKKTLGFRAISNLSVISETDIISEKKSPVMDEQKTEQTYSKSVFRYLLTKTDDLMYEEIEKTEIRKAKNQAKIEYIEAEIKMLETLKIELEESSNNESVQDEVSLEYYKEEILKIESDISIKRKHLKEVNYENNKLNLQRNKTQVIVDKFNLLKEQYISDLERIDFISKGDEVFSAIPNHRCPICHSETYEDSYYKESEITSCYEAEKNKITNNLEELKLTINDLEIEINELDCMLKVGEENSELYAKEIKTLSNKDLKPLKSMIQSIIEKQIVKTKVENLDSTILRKKADISTFKEVSEMRNESISNKVGIDESIYLSLCEMIKNALIECGDIAIENVEFDKSAQDIKINGRSRLSNGKGYRAFYYSIFVGVFMQYMYQKKHDFTKVLVLDSPLTTLHESELYNKKDDDFIISSLQDGLFRYFANNFNDMQVIIIENKKPPEDLRGKYNEISFTRNISEGRFGFLYN